MLPHAAPGPAYKAIVDRRVRTVLLRAILPTAAPLQDIQDTADHPPVVDTALPRTSLDTSGYIRAHCSSLSQNELLRVFRAPLNDSIRQFGIERTERCRARTAEWYSCAHSSSETYGPARPAQAASRANEPEAVGAPPHGRSAGGCNVLGHPHEHRGEGR